MTLARLLDPDAEDIGLRHARERIWLQSLPVLTGHAPGRLAWLATCGYAWSDREVAAWDAMVLERVAELMGEAENA